MLVERGVLNNLPATAYLTSKEPHPTAIDDLLLKVIEHLEAAGDIDEPRVNELWEALRPARESLEQSLDGAGG
jgi:hypothetical protein